MARFLAPAQITLYNSAYTEFCRRLTTGDVCVPDLVLAHSFAKWTVDQQMPTCAKCCGTGVWAQKTARTQIDGSTTPLVCYACQGKGYESEADQRRNWGYHMFYYRLNG
jgi:hypothetical protein